MAWSRKSAMFAALAIALYLLGLVLRNPQLVTVAVVLLSFLTWAAFRTSHADVAASGRRMDDAETCLLYTSPSPRDRQKSRMPSSA